MRVTLEEVGQLFSRPATFERFGPAFGAQPMLVADIDVDVLDVERTEAIAAGLDAIPAVTVAVADRPIDPALESVIAAFDVVLVPLDTFGAGVPVEDADARVRLLQEAIDANPIAAVTMAQLLRLSADRTVPQALVAESLAYSTLQSGPEFQRWLSAQPERSPATSDEPAVLTERTPTALVVTLHRPSHHNAFSAAMRDGLIEALQLALVDDSLDGVILRGEGPSFCSGGDLSEFGTTPDPATAHAVRSMRSVAHLLHLLEGRVRAQVHGSCLGAGVELPAYTGTVLADEASTFCLPEVAMGLVPGAGGTASLPRRIGRHRTNDLAITGRTIDAREALLLGLIDRITTTK